MNSRLSVFLLVAALSGGLVACRELTAPGSADLPGPIELLVLDENGDPLVDREVLVTNVAFVPLADEVEWRGRTSEEGRVAVDLPAGRYAAVVWNHGELFSRWIEPAIDLREGFTVLDPRPHLRTGRVLIPESLHPDRYRLALDATLTHGIRPMTFGFEANIDLNGEFVSPWLDDMSYVVDLIEYPTRVRLDDDFILAASDSLYFEWTPEEFQIRLTLGGKPVPPASIRLTVATPGSNVANEITPDGLIVPFLGEAGFGRLSIQSNQWMPFMDYEAPFEFRAGEVGQIELGDHRVEFNLATSDGRELYGCYVRASHATTSRTLSRSVAQARVTYFLRPGQYKLRASHSGYEDATLLADIASDSTFTFLLGPEEP